MEITDKAKIILDKVQDYQTLLFKKFTRPLKWTNGDEEKLQELISYINRLTIS